MDPVSNIDETRNSLKPMLPLIRSAKVVGTFVFSENDDKFTIACNSELFRALDQQVDDSKLPVR